MAAAPSPTSENVRSPAGESRISRSKPMANVNPNAVATRACSSTLSGPPGVALSLPLVPARPAGRSGHGFGSLPAALGQLGFDGGAVETPHGLPQPAAHLGHDAGVAVVGGGLDDGPAEAG